MDTQTQVERLIELAIIQRAELKRLVDELPQLREHLNAEVERTFEQAEPQIRIELEEFVAKQAEDKTAKLGSALEAKVAELAKTLQDSAQAKFSALIAAREQNDDLLKQAEERIAAAAADLPLNVKSIVLAELERFPRAGEIDRLRKEFAEPRGLNPRGKWSSSEVYQKLDLVSYNGDSFVSSINDNRERPSRNSDAWTLSAARGLGGTGGGISLKDQYGGGDYGQLLIGNGGDYSRNTLTAGTGVTIENGAGTITISASGGGGGQTLTATVYNAEAVPITKGQVVYVYQANGNKPSVKLASNTAESTSSKTFGVVSDTSIAAGATGTVMCQGEVSGLNLGSYTEGATVYLDSTAGQFTQTKPSAPNHLVYVGYVTRANAGSGILYVKIQNGYELEELHNVAITTPTAGDTIIYDQSASLWKNAKIAGGTNVSVTYGDAAATVSLTGTVSITNGGTGASTTAGARSNLGVTATGQDTTYLYRANNLSDLASATTARSNLGLGTIATQAASSVSFTGGSASNVKVWELIEDGTVSAVTATGAINYDVKTQTVLYYTNNASATWTLNIRGDSGTSLDSMMATGDIMTIAFLVPQGATTYYCTQVSVDGSVATPKWQGGTAPTSGNASGIDAYTYTLIKTASATFTVLAAQTQFK